MARLFLVALALAQGVSAIFDEFVDVVVSVEHRVPIDAFSGVLNAAGGSDGGWEACYTANNVLEYCYDAGYMEPTAPVAAADRCLCCDGTTALATVYSSCASYARDELPEATAEYSAISSLYRYCGAMATCTSTRRQTQTAVNTRTASVTIPAVCTSFVQIYNSCSIKVGFETARVTDAVECLCPTSGGDWNTDFQDYASSCAPWASTAYPTDYDLITRLATVCDDFPPGSTAPPLVLTTAGTRTGNDVFVPEVTGTSTTTSASETSEASETSGADAESATTSVSSALAVPGAAVPGIFVWFANLASFVLSFFILL
ncbi:hypothetical protein N658DRAFT_497455 [Parathielavia hyrcaniae]|uniref:Uncharacterized protein n=1 Tax=Parathielavia hyrcaniae TaxID=113614 RepID=A0AAN6PYD4_9PEZI|nr:hypothetical protein N658DRAFT_497455 [Parathielavia hyrcaniae]